MLSGDSAGGLPQRGDNTKKALSYSVHKSDIVDLLSYQVRCRCRGGFCPSSSGPRSSLSPLTHSLLGPSKRLDDAVELGRRPTVLDFTGVGGLSPVKDPTDTWLSQLGTCCDSITELQTVVSACHGLPEETSRDP